MPHYKETIDQITEEVVSRGLTCSLFKVFDTKECYVSRIASGSQVGQINFKGKTWKSILEQLKEANPTKDSLKDEPQTCKFWSKK